MSSTIKDTKFDTANMDDILTASRGTRIKAAAGYYLATYCRGVPDSLLQVARVSGFMPRTVRIRTRQVTILVDGNGGVLTQLGAWDMDERFGWKCDLAAQKMFQNDPPSDIRELRCASHQTL